MDFQVVSAVEYGLECDDEGCVEAVKGSGHYILVEQEAFMQFLQGLYDDIPEVKKEYEEIARMLGADYSGLSPLNT